MIYSIYTYNLIYVYVCIYIHTIIYHIVWYVCIKPHSDPGTSFWPWPFRSFLGPDPCPELLAVKEFRSWCPKKNENDVFFGWTKLWYKLSWCSPRYYGNYGWDRDQKRVSTIASKGHPLLPAMLACGDGTGPGDRETGTGASGCQVLRSSQLGDSVIWSCHGGLLSVPKKLNVGTWLGWYRWYPIAANYFFLIQFHDVWGPLLWWLSPPGQPGLFQGAENTGNIWAVPPALIAIIWRCRGGGQRYFLAPMFAAGCGSS